MTTTTHQSWCTDHDTLADECGTDAAYSGPAIAWGRQDQERGPLVRLGGCDDADLTPEEALQLAARLAVVVLSIRRDGAVPTWARGLHPEGVIEREAASFRQWLGNLIETALWTD